MLNLADRVDNIVKGYGSARLQDATVREFRSVIEHIEFLAEIAGPASAATELKRTLHERLSAASD